MRIFGRHRVAKASASERASSSSEAGATAMADPTLGAGDGAMIELDQTDEMPILRESARLAAVPPLVLNTPEPTESQVAPPTAPIEDSDVFVSRHNAPEISADEMAAAAAAAAANVTLFVYGWENVEPGPLSWVFPSLRAALEAVRAMRNAVEWTICSGADWDDVDAARAKGAVLVEQNA